MAKISGLFVTLFATLTNIRGNIIKDDVITCDAPTIEGGEAGRVTCYFPADVSSMTSYVVTVERYPLQGGDPNAVFECTRVEGKEQDDCKPNPGYTFDGKIGRQLQLTIINSTVDNVGRYACKLLSPAIQTPHSEPCVFVLSGMPISTIPSTDTSGNQTTDIVKTEGSMITTIVIPVVIVVVSLAVCIIVAILLHKRIIPQPCRRGSRERTDPNIEIAEGNPNEPHIQDEDLTGPGEEDRLVQNGETLETTHTEEDPAA